MSAYIGNAPGIGQDQLFVYFPSDRQTTLSGADARGIQLYYTIGEPFVEVQVNGRILGPGDYTATTGNTIVLVGGSFNGGDLVVVRARSAVSLANTYTTAAADALFTAKIANSLRYMGQFAIGPGSGTLFLYAATTHIRVRMVGAGGGGGAVPNATTAGFVAAGGGGAAGGYVEFVKRINGTALTYSVGAQGVGGAAGSNGGTTGGNTSLSENGTTIATAFGGTGGNTSGATSLAAAPSGAPGTGGSASVSGNTYPTDGSLLTYIYTQGQDGGFGYRFGTSNQGLGGPGGSSQFGAGARGLNAVGQGNVGVGFGTGGGGALSIGVDANRAGGNGTGGAMIVEEFTLN
jgi:hypothetical protein